MQTAHVQLQDIGNFSTCSKTGHIDLAHLAIIICKTGTQLAIL